MTYEFKPGDIAYASVGFYTSYEIHHEKDCLRIVSHGHPVCLEAQRDGSVRIGAGLSFSNLAASKDDGGVG